MTEEIQREDSGKVIQINGKRVKVELERGGGCKSCQLRGMCFAKNSPAIFDLETDLILEEGDRVSLEISPGGRVLSSVLIFLMPVLLLFAGYLIASRFFGELPSIGFGFLGLVLSFAIVRWVDRNYGHKLKVRIGARL